MDREPNAQPPENRPDRPLVETQPPNPNPAQSPIAPTNASGSYAPPPDGQVDRGQYPLNESARAEWPAPPAAPILREATTPPAAADDQSFEREPDVGTGKTKPAPAIDKEPKGGQPYYELEQPRPMPED